MISFNDIVRMILVFVIRLFGVENALAALTQICLTKKNIQKFHSAIRVTIHGSRIPRRKELLANIAKNMDLLDRDQKMYTNHYGFSVNEVMLLRAIEGDLFEQNDAIRLTRGMEAALTYSEEDQPNFEFDVAEETRQERLKHIFETESSGNVTICGKRLVVKTPEDDALIAGVDVANNEDYLRFIGPLREWLDIDNHILPIQTVE